MRIVIASVVFALLLPATGCKDKPKGVDEKTQRDLAARRDALLASRKKITEDKEKIEAEIKSVEAQGGDTTGLRKQLTDLATTLETQQTQQMSEFMAKVDAIAVSGDSNANIAAREASLARREADLAQREAELAKRLAAGGGAAASAAGNPDVNAKLLAQMTVLSEKCGQPMAPTTVISAPPPGSSYSKAEVTQLMSRARSLMSQKGILNSDLSDPGLDSEVSKSMSAGDWSKAYFAAGQLLRSVEGVKINRPFIQQKHARLSSRVGNAKLGEAANKQIVSGLADVTQKYNDGQLDAANRKLNELFSLL
jgi:hypothetical protein